MDSRNVSVWSPRSDGGVDINSIQAHFMLTPSARHSKSLDQLGPEITPQPTRTSPKTLPRSASTQLFPRLQRGVINVTLPTSVPSRGRSKSSMSSSGATLIPPTRQQACSAPNPSLGSTPIATLPRAKSTQMLVPNSCQQSQSITSLLAAMFPEIPSGDHFPGYRPSTKSYEHNLTVPSCVGTLDLAQLTSCFNSNSKAANFIGDGLCQFFSHKNIILFIVLSLFISFVYRYSFIRHEANTTRTKESSTRSTCIKFDRSDNFRSCQSDDNHHKW